jgi:hypothetical protein
MGADENTYEHTRYYLVLDDYRGGSWITPFEPPPFDRNTHFGSYHIAAAGTREAMKAAQCLLDSDRVL